MAKKLKPEKRKPGKGAALIVQTAGNPSNAQAGEKGATVAASALLSVLVTRASDGSPVSNLGSTAGDQTSVVALPAGWELLQGFNVPPGGCLMSVTEFVNQGNGIYSIRVVPFVENENCAWLSGQYHYAVQIAKVVKGKSHQGSGLGVLAIP
jgi:hypothetical protein